MQGIEFETDQSSPVYIAPTPKKSGLFAILEKLGIADTNTANYILLGVAAIFFGVAIFLYAGIISGPVQSPLSIQEQQILLEMTMPSPSR